MKDTDFGEEIAEFIRENFESNYEELRAAAAHSIAPDVKAAALHQVLLYWRVMRDVALNVSDTEVRLSLPAQATPQGRIYSIEGIVDILRGNARTVMYDIKTHDAAYVRANLELYAEQLNVYAHIWQTLRHQNLDEMAIIATHFPESVGNALSDGNADELDYALQGWQPLVEVDFHPESVAGTIAEFGRVVDDIEERRFGPPPVDRLKEVLLGTRNVRFATQVCRNCDVRFSCSSYRDYAWRGPRQVGDRSIGFYLEEAVGDAEQEAWRAENLLAAQTAADLRADFSAL